MKTALSDARARIAAMETLLPRCSSNKKVIANLRRRLHGCHSVLGKAKQEGDINPLAGLPRHRRALLEEFLDALHGCISNRKNADALVERVTRRLVRQYID
jgi:chorismate mutase